MFEEHAEALIEKFFDGDLTVEERGELEALTASRSAFRRRLADDMMARSVVQSTPQGWRKPGFADRVMAAIKEEAALQDHLLVHRPSSFGPRFVHRVMSAVASCGFSADRSLPDEFSEALVRLFPRVAAPVVAAIAVAMISNIHAATAGTPLIDALFGLPSGGGLDLFGIGDDGGK